MDIPQQHLVQFNSETSVNIIRLLRQGSASYLILALFTGVLSGLSLTFLVQMIHRALTSEAPDPVRFIGFYMLVWAAYLLCTTISTITTSGLAHKALYQLREWVTDRVLNVSFRATEGRSSEYFPILTEDIQIISNTIYRIPAMTTAFATILGCIGYMFYLSWQLTSRILIAFVIVYITMTAFGRRAQHYSRLARTQYDKIYHFFEDLVYGLKELKLNPVLRKHYRETLFPPLIRDHQQFKLRENVLFNFSIRSIEILFFPVLGVLVYSIFVYGLATTDAFTGVLTVMLFMLSPLSNVANFVSEYKAMQVSLHRVNGMETQINSNTESKRPQEKIQGIQPDRPILELENIRLTYKRDDGEPHFMMGPLNVQIPDGKITFIVGENGSGKSTLAKVLTGLYAPDTGKIRYKGVAIEPHHLEDYRSRFSSVFSDFHLFRELPPAAYDVEALPRWLKVMDLSDKVEISGNNLRHRKLSQGQRERLAFAIACSYTSEIMLLDEIASNQDAEFKKRIYNEILPELRNEGKTIIAISHDDRFFDKADNLIHFRNGNIL
ncbi:MAG: cyclic peptide export ABC transporter [Balneolales bacterium]|nr:cyclic peptide export ABC transporter [Balneolales bacterium]